LGKHGPKHTFKKEKTMNGGVFWETFENSGEAEMGGGKSRKKKLSRVKNPKDNSWTSVRNAGFSFALGKRKRKKGAPEDNGKQELEPKTWLSRQNKCWVDREGTSDRMGGVMYKWQKETIAPCHKTGESTCELPPSRN